MFNNRDQTIKSKISMKEHLDLFTKKKSLGKLSSNHKSVTIHRRKLQCVATENFIVKNILASETLAT